MSKLGRGGVLGQGKGNHFMGKVGFTGYGIV